MKIDILIDLKKFQPETLLIAGVIIGLVIEAVLVALVCFINWRTRRSYLRGCTETEKLCRARFVEDPRNDTPLPEPPPASSRF